MSLRPRDQKERGCTDKVRLADEWAARALAMSLMATGRFTGAKAWVYQCRYCRGFHITSKFARDNLPGAVTADNPFVVVEARA